MSELRTKPTKVSAKSHIAVIANEEQRKDARTLVALMRRVTRQEPRMWGPSIVGFGKQDEARISALLGVGTYTIAVIVLLILVLIVMRSSSNLNLNLKNIGYIFTISTFCQLLVIGTYEVFS